ncbi:MAG: AarF/UbiB family protein, partial [Actinomycetes bacterium]
MAASRASRALGVAALLGGIIAAVAFRRRRSEGAPVRASGVVARRAAIARLGSGRVVDLAGVAVRGAVASPERRAELRAAYELRTAEEVALALGGMKGALMKLGQMASYLDHGLSEPVRAALAELQSAAPPMSTDLAATVIAAELGAPPEQIFARWDPHPVAAASIGQVHRALTIDGRDVAVKIQYPGVDAAVASDLENTDLLFNVLGVVFPG